MKIITVLLFGLAVVTAIPFKTEQLLPKVDDVLTYQYVTGGEGRNLLIDQWKQTRQTEQSARFEPDVVNAYHLFTRDNPTVSQPIVANNSDWLETTNYNSSRRTILLLHGWLDSVTAGINTVLVPAFLEAEDVNVIVVDWSHGAGTIAYPLAVINTVISGEAVARFIAWLNEASGSTLDQYHIVGHNLGAHQAGIIGRNLGGDVAYITGLDPAFAGWVTNDDRFTSTDGVYTEVIHTNAGLLGYLTPLADADFYPNGGVDMPGCLSQECDSNSEVIHANAGLLGYLTPLADADFYPNGGVDMPGCLSQECDSNRSFHYFGESIRTGGFTGTRCFTFAAAMAGQCFMSGPLNMGGIRPKTGQSGIFYLRTNAFPPFSRG
ncbi:hypothetical protein PYW07_012748 [Mythimna separata]|uniref:Lipase domain-containing protein n=1 Tax=Mythimna separata TaxID=271217 RepID=A0AAD8DL43_MYTSE|nr:hypothetical protein PYW07_012748 [Mythimna separata]